MASDMDIGLDDMKEIIDEFLVEADELIASLDTNLVTLETTPNDLDLLNEIFRAAHTIKGTSSFLGFDQVSSLTHRMEDVLNKLRKSEMVVTAEIMDLLLASVDVLKQLLHNVRDGGQDTVDLTEITARLEAAAEGRVTLKSAADALAVTAVHNAEADWGAVDGIREIATEARSTEPLSPGKVPPAERRPAHDKKATGEQTIRVDVNRLDSLINLMGELVLGRNSLMQMVGRLDSEAGASEFERVNQSAAAINYITTELQLAIMKMRMQPVGKVFSRFPRQVRDLARDAGKQIELVVSGEDTELDKSVIEEIGDPLVHLIRNSCDHGIETPDDRKAAGKHARGTIWLSASQEGSNIVIKIRDDGRGLDVDAIRSKAVERGLASRAEVDRMTDREVFAYIFEAGFSTAKQITDVSGRGVGMDVVRTNIEKLNGMIELDSARGIGTTISIKLPLTLAIIQGLLVQSDDEVFILPLSSVHETVKTDQAQIYYVNQRPVFRLRDEIIPIVNIGGVLRTQSSGFTLTEKPYIVVVGLAEKKLGINIDRFLGQEEVVIKSLGEYLGGAEGIAGATILGDGRIRLIVDLIGLFSLARKLS